MSTLKPILTELTEWTQAAVQRAFPDAEIDGSKVKVVATNDASHGDYQCNAAMALAKVLKVAPRNVAEAVKGSEAYPPCVAQIEVAGPGFINFHLHTEWVAQRTKALLADDRLGVVPSGAEQTVIIDYSSPNIAKPMHIGHIRSTVIGNALDRMHRFLGYNVIADNHLGDWGTQFGKLIMGYRNFLDEEALAESPAEELERLYVKSHNLSAEDPEWLDQCRSELVKLQQGDEENLALWKEFISLSLEEFEKIYQRLGVTFDLHRGESFYNDSLLGIVEQLEAKGLAVESDGAKIVDLEDQKLGIAMVQKSDGGFNYTTSDLATVQSRETEFSPNAIVYVTDERQQQHFKQFFAISKEMGSSAELVHVWFGLMRLPESMGGTMGTRKGNVIRLDAMLDEAESRALAIVEEKNPNMDAEQKHVVARAIGIGAIKYADLSQNPQSLVTFTWDKALALDGNSAPYLQYVYARTSKVLGDYAERYPDLKLEDFELVLETPVQRKLAMMCNRFGDMLEVATTQYRPNMLAEYLFELAQVNNSFYQDNERPWLKAESPERESRLQLGALVAKVLKQGLYLLGLDTPERI